MTTTVVLTAPSRRAALRETAFEIGLLLATGFGLVTLLALIATILRNGVPWLEWSTVTNQPSADPAVAGVFGPLIGSVWMLVITAVTAFPVGVAAAIYLVEYAPRGRLADLVRINIANLAAVPSIVYGILGLAVFVRGLGLGRVVLAGGLTMALLVLPIVIIASQEALRAVPPSLREASLALGATRWQTVWRVVLPSALPGILTGTILSLARAVGESAPLILAGAVTFVTSTPTSLTSPFTVLPLQIFDWASRPQPEFRDGLAGAAIIVLLVLLLTMNAGAILLRQRLSEER